MTYQVRNTRDCLSPRPRIDVNDLRFSARCRPIRCYRLRAHARSKVLLHLLDPHLGFRDPTLRSRSLQGLPKYATGAIALLLRQGDSRCAPQRLCGVLHSVSSVTHSRGRVLCSTPCRLFTTYVVNMVLFLVEHVGTNPYTPSWCLCLTGSVGN